MIDDHKLKLMSAHMKELGIGQSTYAPPAYRAAWAMGFDITPPLFASFGSNALFLGSSFGAVCGAFAVLVAISRSTISIGQALLVAFGAGLFYGLFVAIGFWLAARKYDLPSWQAYHPGTGT